MFKFCEVFAGRAMVTNAGRANTCRHKFKSPWKKNKIQEMKDLPEMSFRQKPFEVFRRKKINCTCSLEQTTPWNTKYHKLKKTKGAFQKTYLRKNLPVFTTKKLGKCLSCRVDLKFGWFTHVVVKIFSIMHSSRLRKEYARVSLSWRSSSSRKNEKFQHFSPIRLL